MKNKILIKIFILPFLLSIFQINNFLNQDSYDKYDTVEISHPLVIYTTFYFENYPPKTYKGMTLLVAKKINSQTYVGYYV